MCRVAWYTRGGNCWRVAAHVSPNPANLKVQPVWRDGTNEAGTKTLATGIKCVRLSMELRRPRFSKRSKAEVTQASIRAKLQLSALHIQEEFEDQRPLRQALRSYLVREV